MLSRCALRVLQQNTCRTSPLASIVRAKSDAAPERDLVNFPQRQRAIDAGKTRMYIFPEEWFNAFYNKTGVSGPYMALVSIGTFLVSKEYFVAEHDFYAGLALIISIRAIYSQVGDKFEAFLEKKVSESEAEMRSTRVSEIDKFKADIASEQVAQANGTVWEDIIAAKKEAVGLQLESIYRERLSAAHAAVKTRLDYQLEVSNVVRRMEQKHMVDWIISNVRKSISPAQEQAALKKCIADLKALA